MPPLHPSVCQTSGLMYINQKKQALCQSINRRLVSWTNTTKTSHEACPLCCNKMSSGDNSIFYSNKLTNGYFIFQVSFYGSCCVALIQHVRMWPVFLIRFREQNLLCSLHWLSVIYKSLQPLCLMLSCRGIVTCIITVFQIKYLLYYCIL